jgi:cytochrome b
MNTTSASLDEGIAAAAPTRRVLVWDAPVRVFHWLMVASFFGAYVSAESERWRLVHVSLGYTMFGLVAFRLVWGLLGTRHARFANFVRGPAAVLRYLRSLLRGEPEHHLGHNPAGALAIVALLALTVGVAATGWASYNEFGGNWLGEAHELAANLMMAVVAVHVTGVVVSMWLHHENLVGAMVHGKKVGSPHDAVQRAWRGVAALMLVAVLAFWWQQWRAAPSLSPSRPAAAAQAHDDD